MESPVENELKFLANFLNLPDSKLREVRTERRFQWETHEDLTVERLRGSGDTAETLIRLRNEITEHVLKLLDHETPADDAVLSLLERIDGLELGKHFFRLLYDESEHQRREPPNSIEVKRILPAGATQRGKRPPRVDTVKVIEGRPADDARSHFYRVLDEALRSNAVWLIRNCLKCRRFYVDSRKLTYCSPLCETAFNNERKRQKRLLQKTVTKKAKERRTQKRIEVAGRELFEKFRELTKKAKPLAQDKEFLNRVRSRLSARARAAEGEAWETLTKKVREEYIRATAKIYFSCTRV